MSEEIKPTANESEAVALHRSCSAFWSAALMAIVFIYGMAAVFACCSLALGDRWEFWVVVPLPGGAIFSLWNWWLFFKPNVPAMAISREETPHIQTDGN